MLCRIIDVKSNNVLKVGLTYIYIFNSFKVVNGKQFLNDEHELLEIKTKALCLERTLYPHTNWCQHTTNAIVISTVFKNNLIARAPFVYTSNTILYCYP